MPVWFVFSVIQCRLPVSRRPNHLLLTAGAGLIEIAITSGQFVQQLLRWAFDGMMPEPLAFG